LDFLAAFRAGRSAPRPGGAVIVSVPAYAWLWSGHDVALGHRRRYTAGRLRALLSAAALHVEHVGFFNTVLFPAIAGVRLVKRALGRSGHDLHRPSALVNEALTRLFALERHVALSPGLPFGTSLLAVARR
jgi:hypothetical protein